MIAGRAFRLRPILTLVAAGALAILVGLGNWQMQRLEWKRALIASVSEAAGAAPLPFDQVAAGDAAPEYRAVFAQGRFIADGAIKVFGADDATPGYFAFAPLRLHAAGTDASASAADAGRGVVYVNRGFVPHTVDAAAVPAPPSGVVRVEGLLRQRETLTAPTAWFRTTGADADGYWYVRDPVAMAAATGIDDAAAFYIDQFAVDGAPWPKGGATRLEFSNRHFEYALTWFGLAGALFAVWLAMSLTRRP